MTVPATLTVRHRRGCNDVHLYHLPIIGYGHAASINVTNISLGLKPFYYPMNLIDPPGAFRHSLRMDSFMEVWVLRGYEAKEDMSVVISLGIASEYADR